MFLRHKRTNEEIFIEQLYVVRDRAREAIDGLHLGIDSIVYEMHDAAQTLIELLDPQEEENGQA